MDCFKCGTTGFYASVTGGRNLCMNPECEDARPGLQPPKEEEMRNPCLDYGPPLMQGMPHDLYPRVPWAWPDYMNRTDGPYNGSYSDGEDGYNPCGEVSLGAGEECALNGGPVVVKDGEAILYLGDYVHVNNSIHDEISVEWKPRRIPVDWRPSRDKYKDSTLFHNLVMTLLSSPEPGGLKPLAAAWLTPTEEEE